MSWYRYLSTPDVSSQVHSPSRADGVPELLWPFNYTAAAAPSTSDLYPFRVDSEQLAEWCFRLRALSLDVALATPSGNPTATLSLTRKTIGAVAITNEHDLMLPGPVQTDTALSPGTAYDTFHGTYSASGWNGDPLATISVSAHARIAFLGTLAGFNDSLVSSRVIFDEANRLWLPSIEVFVDFAFTTPGLELAYVIENYADNETTPGTFDEYAFSADFLPAHGGGALACRLRKNLADTATATVTVEPVQWFEHRLTPAHRPVWDSATGAEIDGPFIGRYLPPRLA